MQVSRMPLGLRGNLPRYISIEVSLVQALDYDVL